MTEKNKKPKRIPVDFDALSEESRKSCSILDYYEDETFLCVDCGKVCAFPADKQKLWYEVHKRYFWQRPIRCAEHHELWSEAKSQKLKMDHLIADLKKSNSRKLKIECAEAIIKHSELTGRGNLRMATELGKDLWDYKSGERVVNSLMKRIDLLNHGKKS